MKRLVIVLGMFCLGIQEVSAQACQGDDEVEYVNVDFYDQDTVTHIVEIERPRVELIFPKGVSAEDVTIESNIKRNIPEIGLAIPKSEPTEGEVARGEFVSDYRKCLMSPVALQGGDAAVFSISYRMPNQGESGAQRKSLTVRMERAKSGEFKIGVGAFFINDSGEDFFTIANPDGDGFLIRSAGKEDDFGFSAAATASWIPYDFHIGKVGIGPTIGLGSDGDDLIVFGGVSFFFNRGWAFSIGAAMAKERRIDGRFKEQFEQNIPLSENLGVDQLGDDGYEPTWFIGLTWWPGSSE